MSVNLKKFDYLRLFLTIILSTDENPVKNIKTHSHIAIVILQVF